MADTQILATLRRVRAARDAVGARRNDPALNPASAALMQRAYDLLDDLDERLVDAQLQQRLAAVRQDAQALDGIVAGLKASDASLQQIADAVATAAKVTGVLVEVIGAALANGLL